jgi:hypothetical protein
MNRRDRASVGDFARRFHRRTDIDVRDAQSIVGNSIKTSISMKNVPKDTEFF